MLDPNQRHGDFLSTGGGDEPSVCRVLVVDDDPDCLDEYVSTLQELGYPCVSAATGRGALEALAADPLIGIVVTDIHMTGMNGLMLLQEIDVRFAALRPIVALVITGFGSLPVAIDAMRANAIDLLSKPVSRADYAAALRRASSRWAQQVGAFKLTQLSKFSAEIARKGVDAAAVVVGVEPGDALSDDPAPKQLLAMIRQIIKSRQQREQYLDATLFADPAWDILLDLTAARLDGQTVPVSSACIAAQVPMSTGLRWVRQLVEAGLIRRWTDPSDRRRDLVELTDAAHQAMMDYLLALYRQSAGARLS